MVRYLPTTMKWLVLVTLILANLIRQPSPVVRISSGFVRGSVSEDGTFHEFLSIPYATVTPDTRFQAPLPEPKWDGVFEAIDENVKCLQRVTKTDIVLGQADCLTLNVYSPITTSNTPLPVMVFIHGGGFAEGFGQPAVYGPEYLVRHNVVLVVINYRLNIQGFLCLHIKEAPGNAGLKDQVAALRWVQSNIAAFNGDPDNVTIFGESAGAASVSYHILSPMSKGLFKRAIMQSGSSIAPWAIQPDPIGRASLFARKMGHISTDPRELFDIFANTSDRKLATINVPRPKGDILLTELCKINPCIEKQLANVEAFMTEDPFEVLTRGDFNKVDIMTGYNSHEGYLFVGFDDYKNIRNIDINNALPSNLHFPSTEERNSAVNKIKDFYFGNVTDEDSILSELSEYEGDPFFKFPATVEIEEMMKISKSPIYAYEFKYGGTLNILKLLSGFFQSPGASHGDDLFYMFKPRLMSLPQAFFEKDMINKVTTMWTNFAKFGNPTPNPTSLLPTVWRPTNLSDPQVFVIDRELSAKPLWADPAMLLWRDIYSKYRRKGT